MIASSDETVVKVESRDNPDGVVLPDDEIEKIRQEFVAAKKSFIQIPEALKEMPKMNPKGLRLHFVVSAELYNFCYVN